MIYLSIFNFTIEIVFSNYKLNKFACDFHKDYILKKLAAHILKKKVKKKPDFTIKINASEKNIVRSKSIILYPVLIIKNNIYHTYTSISPLLFHNVVMVEVLMDIIGKNQDIVLHCSAIEHNHRAYIFLGKSRSGKSTIVKLLKSNFNPLCDDLAFIRKINDTYYLFQAPIEEKNNYPKTQKGYQIAKIFFLNKSVQNNIQKIKSKDNLVFQKLTINIKNIVSKSKLNKFINTHDFNFLSFKKDASITKHLMSFIETDENR